MVQIARASWRLRLQKLRASKQLIAASIAAAILSSCCVWLGRPSDALLLTLPAAARALWCVELEGHIDRHYYRPEVCVSAHQRTETITSLVRTFSAMLESQDIDYWLDSGTLLGQFRAQSVIPWDDDADFGMTEAGFERLRTTKWRIPAGYELQVMESKFHRARDRDWTIPARLVDTNFGFYVDVFVFAASEANGIDMLGTAPSSCWHACVKCVRPGRSSKFFLVPRSYVFPLLRCPFEDFHVLCPARRTLYLEHLFGEDFRTPRKA